MNETMNRTKPALVACARRGVLLGLLLALSACATTGAVARAARAQQNTAVVLAFLDMAYNKHQVEQAFKLYVGPQYRQHDPRLTREGSPDIRLEVKRTVSQGDLVAVHARYTRAAVQSVVDLFRLEHGKIVEHWDVVQDIPEQSAHDNSMF